MRGRKKRRADEVGKKSRAGRRRDECAEREKEPKMLPHGKEEDSDLLDYMTSSEDEVDIPDEGIDLSDLVDISMKKESGLKGDSRELEPGEQHGEMLKRIREGLGLRGEVKEEANRTHLVTEMEPENPWRVRMPGLSMRDILEDAQINLDTKKRLEKLDRSNRSLAPGLSRQASRRLERAEQYQYSKARISKWLSTVQSMRRADHLSFPLESDLPKQKRVTCSTLATDFAPSTELEKAIQNILELSGIDEGRLKKEEELATRKLDPEELRLRQARLIKMRSLLYYQEQKSRRMNKIKSKKYRRILRKEKEKKKPTLAELAELDPEAYADELLRLEKLRVRERITLKHGNRTSWAKYALRSKDPNLRQSVQDHLRHGRELLKKMGSDDEESDEDGEEDVDEAEENEKVESGGDILDINGEVIREEKKVCSDTEEEGVFRMEFMKRAAKKRKESYDEMVSEMREEDQKRYEKMISQMQNTRRCEGVIGSDSDDGLEENDQEREDVGKATADSEKATTPSNRMRFCPSSKDLKLPLVEADDSVKLSGRTMTIENSGFESRLGEDSSTSVKFGAVPVEGADNKDANDVEGCSETRPDDPEEKNLKKRYFEFGSKKTHKKSDSPPAVERTSVVDEANPWLANQCEDEEDEVKREKTGSGEAEGSLDIKKIEEGLDKRGHHGFKLLDASNHDSTQLELVNQAFAADHAVLSEFEKEKLEQVEKENDVEKEYAMLTLPGWGEWAGSGVQPSKRRKKLLEEMEKKKAERSKELLEARSDSKLPHVIINQKKFSRIAKYQAVQVPHEYAGNAELYNASLRQPLGKEWNTFTSHAALIRPRVLVQSGQIIRPISLKQTNLLRK
ncbi:uncharacterized protein LOC126322576 [Schistocerca gregaria]|uniref:uncharacterized protein LOC126322576 n=1 Tax=Schistocerca gregaria TaxID=7010 RepID=UPI00211F3B29|nr:uncharacterized protein LOC126322576 [Schistocerca gregaria]